MRKTTMTRLLNLAQLRLLRFGAAKASTQGTNMGQDFEENLIRYVA